MRRKAAGLAAVAAPDRAVGVGREVHGRAHLGHRRELRPLQPVHGVGRVAQPHLELVAHGDLGQGRGVLQHRVPGRVRRVPAVEVVLRQALGSMPTQKALPSAPAATDAARPSVSAQAAPSWCRIAPVRGRGRPEVADAPARRLRQQRIPGRRPVRREVRGRRTIATAGRCRRPPRRSRPRRGPGRPRGAAAAATPAPKSTASGPPDACRAARKAPPKAALSGAGPATTSGRRRSKVEHQVLVAPDEQHLAVAPPGAHQVDRPVLPGVRSAGQPATPVRSAGGRRPVCPHVAPALEQVQHPVHVGRRPAPPA